MSIYALRGVFLEVNRILAEIDAQIAKLQQARALLAGGSSAAPAVKKAVGRPRKSITTSASKATPKKRTLSAEARKRIADAQKKRWAETRKSQK
ncbi:hypothetical protein SAMN05444167_1471 [Terriglobus roseus]|uniref:Uncharacterized protein n=1 Tax=Terriglobus roseus TaxID=392734 RepID=A0A1G7IJ90_9BACT|nr:hypothetical protein SAMN05444167_1471 [Terriglobus roseus]